MRRSNSYTPLHTRPMVQSRYQGPSRRRARPPRQVITPVNPYPATRSIVAAKAILRRLIKDRYRFDGLNERTLDWEARQWTQRGEGAYQAFIRWFDKPANRIKLKAGSPRPGLLEQQPKPKRPEIDPRAVRMVPKPEERGIVPPSLPKQEANPWVKAENTKPAPKHKQLFPTGCEDCKPGEMPVNIKPAVNEKPSFAPTSDESAQPEADSSEVKTALLPVNETATQQEEDPAATLTKLQAMQPQAKTAGSGSGVLIFGGLLAGGLLLATMKKKKKPSGLSGTPSKKAKAPQRKKAASTSKKAPSSKRVSHIIF